MRIYLPLSSSSRLMESVVSIVFGKSTQGLTTVRPS